MNNWNDEGDGEIHFPTLQDLFSKSIISVEEFYRNCLIVSYKTANSQHDCENMPYWKFNNLLTFLDEVISKENGDPNNSQQNDATTQHQQAQQQAKQQHSSAMRQAKSQMKMPSVPKHRMR